MAQNKRQQAINGFRSGKYDILVATDIAARGIDVTDISHVINYDMPDTVDAYTHRIGRTGRAEQSGEAFTFAGDEDVAMIRQIERVLDMEIERRRLPEFDYGPYVPTLQTATGSKAWSGSRSARRFGATQQRRRQSSPAPPVHLAEIARLTRRSLWAHDCCVINRTRNASLRMMNGEL